VPASVSPEGAVIGSFFDANFVSHGFLRIASGAIATFDEPNAGTTGNFPGTSPVAFNERGAIVGCFGDNDNSTFAFLRDSAGIYSTLIPPGGSVGGFSSACFTTIFSVSPSTIAINALGEIAGNYFQPLAGNGFGGNFRGFVRNRKGTFSEFDAVPSPSSPCCTCGDWKNGGGIVLNKDQGPNPDGEIV